ncbi:hypothetical protein [Legionella sp. W05-934-2]|uniref:hypothetical protein n=1 Tax=Legionella sp. W05-934-2 TaxID=1198649 RepID=UPI0034635F74
MPKSTISQGNAIDIINDYLAWHNLPIELNRNGVCHGLAIIRAQYIFEGKEEEFFKMLEKIVDMSQGNFTEITTSDDPLSGDIDHFIFQVLIAYKPDVYDKRYTQRNAHEIIKVAGHPLVSDFTLPLVTSKTNWVSIFKELNMQDGEVFNASSPNHTISIYRKNGQYVVYDPNYNLGRKTFNNEEQLVEELRKNVFVFDGGNLALVLKQLRPADKPANANRRSAQDFYNRYLDVKQKAKYDNHEVTTLQLACTENDDTLLKTLFKKSEKIDLDTLENSIAIATSLNADRTLDAILNYQDIDGNRLFTKPDSVNLAILLSLKNGSMECFKVILKEPTGDSAYRSFINPTSSSSNFIIKSAAQGGNPDLLRQILQDMDNSVPSPVTLAEKLFAVDKIGRNTLTATIEGGSSECLKILLERLSSEKFDVDVKQYEALLGLAIEKNNFLMVDHLLNHMPERQKQSIIVRLNLSVSQAEKTDLHILNSLEKNGADFSGSVKMVMKDKQTHKLSSTSILGVKLTSFVEYIKIKLGLTKHISFDEKAVNKEKVWDFKKSLREIKGEFLPKSKTPELK